MKKYSSIDEYYSDQPADVQHLLNQVRNTIRKEAPDAFEVISYNMPAFKRNKIIVYYAGLKNHIGLYPMASGIERFKKEFESLGYKYSKGAVQFPLGKPLPFDLIARIVKFRLSELEAKAAAVK
jgi:uncharacterized protein YdhG (YjbR/CyaY superfamily)